jgi:hypothetical protein
MEDLRNYRIDEEDDQQDDDRELIASQDDEVPFHVPRD